MIKKNFNKLIICFKDLNTSAAPSSALHSFEGVSCALRLAASKKGAVFPFKDKGVDCIKYFKSLRDRGNFQIQYSFILPFILSKIEWGDHVNVEPVGNSYFLAVFLLGLVALSCFYNVMAYFFSLYLLQRYNIKEWVKYPKLQSIVKYYEKSGFIFIVVECIICVVALLILCISGAYFYFKFSFSGS